MSRRKEKVARVGVHARACAHPWRLDGDESGHFTKGKEPGHVESE
jgi:hypothetical protein